MPPVERFQLASNVSQLPLHRLFSKSAEPVSISAEEYENFDEVANYADSFVDLDHLKQCFQGATILSEGIPAAAVELSSSDVHLLISRATEKATCKEQEDTVTAVITRNESNGPYVSDMLRKNKVRYEQFLSSMNRRNGMAMY